MDLDNEDGEAPNLVQGNPPQARKNNEEAEQESSLSEASGKKVPITIITGNQPASLLATQCEVKVVIADDRASMKSFEKHNVKYSTPSIFETIAVRFNAK